MGTVLSVDVARIALRIPVFGLRKYEAGRLSAYAWGTIGLALGLALFPTILVIPAFCGMAWIDPLCAWARASKKYPWLPAIGYTAVFASLLGITRGGLSVPAIVALTAIATPLALLAEYADLRLVDDDFLMTVITLIGLTFVLGPIKALL